MKLISEKDFPELQRDPVTGVWYVRKFVTGKGELFRSTKERKSKLKAKSIALKLLSEFTGTPYGGRSYKFKELADEVVKLKESKSPATHASAKHHLENRIIPAIGHMRMSQINESVITDYFDKMKKKFPGGKLFNDCKHINMVLKRAWEKGLLSRPMRVDNPDGQVAPRYVFTEKEEYLLLDNANPKLRLQILMGFRMGMRPGEILNLQLDRIHLDEGLIKLKISDTKTRTSREVPIHDEVVKPLRDAMNATQGKYLFGNRKDANRAPVRNANRPNFERLKKKLGLERGTLHDLRRTCATRMGRSSLPPAIACKILGMSLRTYLTTYCRPSSEEIRDSFQQHFGFRGISGNMKKIRTKGE